MATVAPYEAKPATIALATPPAPSTATCLPLSCLRVMASSSQTVSSAAA